MKYSDLPKEYPGNLIEAIKTISIGCLNIISKYDVNKVIIEHTEGSGRQRISQRFLEWLHYVVYSDIVALGIPTQYLLVSDWRREIGCYLSLHPKYRKWNARISRIKRSKSATISSVGARIAKINGKIVRNKNIKDLSIELVRKAYKINITNDNIADAINIGTAALRLNIWR